MEDGRIFSPEMESLPDISQPITEFLPKEAPIRKPFVKIQGVRCSTPPLSDLEEEENPKHELFELLPRCLACRFPLNFHILMKMIFRKEMEHTLRAKTRARKDSLASLISCLGLSLGALSLEDRAVKKVSGREAIPERL